MSRIKLYPAFEHWQKHGNILLFSDPHWGDDDREFMGYNISEKEQCKKIIENVHSGDTLICLGDVGNPAWIEWIKRRRTHLYTVLITGNHDKGNEYYKPYFDEIYNGPVMISSKIMLSHEPCTGPWLNIHGHRHEDSYSIYFQEDRAVRINLAGNVVDFSAYNLNSAVKEGILKNIEDIHRITINNASERALIKG